ncbi:MAG: YkgJ family cysteine cluster protein [Acidobacteriota bacterium]
MNIHNVPAVCTRMNVSDTFHFSCHKGLSCFGSCCRNRDLRLTPYDVLRLKRALKLHSDAFLAEYTSYTLDPTTGFPAISLKISEDENRQCPFLTSDGCRVYTDRPTVCRLFPLARVSGFKQDSRIHDEFFYMLPSGHCRGIHEERLQSIDQWMEAQGVAPYRKTNDKMLHLLFHPERGKDRALSEKQLQKIVVACYNLDVFREFIFNTDFARAFSIDATTLEAIKDNDSELLAIGFAYLRTTLFSTPGT